MTTINIYKNITQTTGGDDIPVDIFLDNIRDGKWQDYVLPIRAIKDKKLVDAAKKKVPYVTISGKFNERKDSELVSHSGFIGIDIDDIDPEETKSYICPDPYCYAAFTSISGTGLCVVMRINGEKHRETFDGIRQYLFDKYQIVIDPTSVNPSRARFVSFDPHMYLNTKADKFNPPAKRKAEKKIPQIVYVQSDFELILKEIQARNIDITGGYQEWLNIGFAFADKFGEAGREYYHIVSGVSNSYNEKLTDRQYTNCLKANKSGITIASFYFYAKQAGITTVSAQTKLISQTALYGKKGGRSNESVVELLSEIEGIPAADSQDIVSQVYQNNVQVQQSESQIDDVAMWLKQNHDLKRNLITRYIEDYGKPVQKRQLNSIFLSAAKVFDKVSFELVERIIDSDFTPEYNPLHDFFDKYQARKPKGLIKAFFECIQTDTGLSEANFFPNYAVHFGTKWLVGAIASAYGQHSPLMFVLSGNVQNTGKTEFWRRFLPAELKQYYAESKLDAGKDDEILMTQKWFIMDDEMGGKSKKESKLLKNITSKQTFSLREPYGKGNVDLERLAVLCATTNENEIIDDPTGNRRVIPTNVLSIDHAAYNKIDKIDLLMEAYWLWKEGFEWKLTKEDISILTDNTTYFEQTSPEYDLLVRHFEPELNPNSRTGFFTATEIKAHLEKISMQRLNPNRLGLELKKAGFIRATKRVNGMPLKGYHATQKFMQEFVVSSSNL